MAMGELVLYEAAKSAVAQANSFDEVKEIRDKAQALSAYAKQAKDSEMIEWATEIKVRAERRAGEMLAQTDKNTGPRMNGGGASPVVEHCDRREIPTLADIGVTKDQSSRWQRLALMPEEHFQAAVETAKASVGAVTTAFMLREARTFTNPEPVPDVARTHALPRAAEPDINAYRAWHRELAAIVGLPLMPDIVDAVREAFEAQQV